MIKSFIFENFKRDVYKRQGEQSSEGKFRL